jgi:hypothetical protein
MILCRCSPATPQSLMLQSIVGLRSFERGAERETFGVQMHSDVVREKNAEGTAVEVNATSTGRVFRAGHLSIYRSERPDRTS